MSTENDTQVNKSSVPVGSGTCNYPWVYQISIPGMVVWIGLTSIDSCVSSLAIRSGTIRRCGIIGGALFGRSASLCRWALRSPSTQVSPSAEETPPLGCLCKSLLLPSDQDVALLAPPAPCLLAHCHVSCHNDNGLWNSETINLWNYKPAPIKCFLL